MRTAGLVASVLCVLAPGCTFVPASATGGPADADAPAAHDAAAADSAPPGLDAAPGDASAPADASVPVDAVVPTDAPWCAAGVTSTTGTVRGHVGGTGGGTNFGPLRCDHATDLIVGVAVEMSNQNTTNGGRSAQAIQITCASVAIDPAGGAHLGTPYTHVVSGNGNGSWSPSTWSPVASCPSGSVLAGMSAYTGTNRELFQNVTLTCVQLGATAAPGAASAVAVTGSLGDTHNQTTATCGSGEVVTALPNKTGDGLDGVDLSCAPTSCQ